MPINKLAENRNIKSGHDLPDLPIWAMGRSDSPASLKGKQRLMEMWLFKAS